MTKKKNLNLKKRNCDEKHRDNVEILVGRAQRPMGFPKEKKKYDKRNEHHGKNYDMRNHFIYFDENFNKSYFLGEGIDMSVV